MNTAFANLYQSDFTHTESERRLSAAAEQYVSETEAYDRTVCTGPIKHGAIMPTNAHERGLVNRNAMRAMDRLCMQHPEFTRQQILREVSTQKSEALPLSAFVANGPTTGGHINTDPFWPSIDLEQLRATLRIDNSVTPARLETAVIAAAINLNRELKSWKAKQLAAGYATLTDVPDDKINDVPVQAHLYRRAIEAGTGAEICERYRDYSATNTGNDKAEEVAPTIDDYRRDLRWAVRDFLGISRTTVELI